MSLLLWGALSRRGRRGCASAATQRATESLGLSLLPPHTPHRKVSLTRVTLPACRSLGAIFRKTSKLFYPEASTWDGKFAEGRLTPKPGVVGAQHWQHCYSNSEPVENDVQVFGFFLKITGTIPSPNMTWKMNFSLCWFGLLCKSIFVCSN